MSYVCRCEKCGCEIYMEDKFDTDDDRRCEECRSDNLDNETSKNTHGVTHLKAFVYGDE